ncbi:MAG: peptide chain release factor N(5)-glutamine methyltransferase [Candidatus Buchananbacteria bacterium CG10_big_fil_rev_8_21_14_0_10_42_9]|uniref:peptide chain release factor N(5)-glutamine methyltransferase n=1 Tax=Candidatus Buchananbacteria bacterium CG10_big_fil_rev_8_21_14_0_10_42_9 TaxID=1974526 RepID=A0A2H0W4R7_9BACT|nr:MAG: peptide chain release factor N(5)-glutamine methyltransferase [Candidatus Buchananbacteria bacterium CG10_big_fil_rev_8_21_14_0_10_42_9]
MTINNLLQDGSIKLKRANIQTAALDAEILLAHVLNSTRSKILSQPKSVMHKKQIDKFNALIKVRSKFVPVAYLTKQREFYGLNFYVNENVLVPRPATELMIENVLSLVRPNQTVTIADVGTGSGCIAVTLAHHLPKATILATDISKKALVVAQKNAQALAKNKKVSFWQGNLLEPIKVKKIDIIIANLPYLKPTDLGEPTIQAEPKLALWGGDDGLQTIKCLINQTASLPAKPSYVMLEFNHGQAGGLSEYIERILDPSELSVYKDNDGLDRTAVIKL